jgi:hypothetical protein
VKLESSSTVERSGCAFIALKGMLVVGMQLEKSVGLAGFLALVALESMCRRMVFLKCLRNIKVSFADGALEGMRISEMLLE